MMRKIWLVFLLLLLTALLDGCKDPAQDAGQENPGNLIVVGFSQVEHAAGAFRRKRVPADPG